VVKKSQGTPSYPHNHYGCYLVQKVVKPIPRLLSGLFDDKPVMIGVFLKINNLVCFISDFRPARQDYSTHKTHEPRHE